MSHRSRSGFVIVAALVAGTVLAAANTSSRLPSGKMHAMLQIKPGLWEFNDTTKVAGDTVFPDAVLATVPPAQRAQHLAELRQMISQPSRERECITQAIFEQRLFGIEPSCKRIVATNTPSRLEVLTECRGDSGSVKQSKASKIVAGSSTNVISSFRAVSTQGVKTMTVDSVEIGRWVSSNCGNVHGIQLL